jgi:hypothetical protein
MATTTTPWGKAAIVEEVSLPQKNGDKRFTSLVQLLETEKGERFVRFAYATERAGGRGPVTLRAPDLVRLHEALQRTPQLKEALLGS